MSSADQDTGDYSARGSTLLERVVARFEEAWQHGLQPAIQDYLPGDAADAQAILVELVHTDMEFRIKGGEEARVERYFEQYPALRNHSPVAHGLIAAEYVLRRRARGEVAVEEYFRRFPEEQGDLQKILAAAGSQPSGLTFSGRVRRGQGPRNDRLTGDSGEIGPGAEIDEASLPTDFGRYLLTEVVGRGAFATVYRACDPQLNREVAIKIPRWGVLETREQVERFFREARAGARLRHPNICPVYDVGEYQGRHHIVMALIAGSPLSEFIKPEKPLDVKTAVKLVLRLTAALAEAHEQGVIHRDLKPSNIIFDKKRREPVILDFGLAKELQASRSLQTQSGQILGTPCYMSPEQAKGAISQVGPASDVYSLGVILYELITGRLPFAGSVAEVFSQILTRDAEPPSRHRADLDPDIDWLCLKAMSRDPRDRFDSMEDMGAALKRYLANPHQGAFIRPADRKEPSTVKLEPAGGQRVVIRPPADASIYGVRTPVETATPDPAAVPGVQFNRFLSEEEDRKEPSGGPSKLSVPREFVKWAFRSFPTPGSMLFVMVMVVLVTILTFGLLYYLLPASVAPQ